MGKHTPVRVSYRDEIYILYRVYTITRSFHISLFEGTLYKIIDKYTCDSKLQALFMHYQFQSTSRLISHQNEWSFHVYMILVQDFVPE